MPGFSGGTDAMWIICKLWMINCQKWYNSYRIAYKVANTNIIVDSLPFLQDTYEGVFAGKVSMEIYIRFPGEHFTR